MFGLGLGLGLVCLETNLVELPSIVKSTARLSCIECHVTGGGRISSKKLGSAGGPIATQSSTCL